MLNEANFILFLTDFAILYLVQNKVLKHTETSANYGDAKIRTTEGANDNSKDEDDDDNDKNGRRLRRMQESGADGNENGEGSDGKGEGNEGNDGAKEESDDEIIIIILSILLGLTILILCIIGFVCYKRKKKQNNVTFNYDHDDGNPLNINSQN